MWASSCLLAHPPFGCPYFGTAVRPVCVMASRFLGVLPATIEFVLTAVLVLIAIGVISESPSLMKVLLLTAAADPPVLLQP